MNFTDLVLGESYEFSPLPSAIWPNYTNARFTGQVSYDVASSFSSVAAQHASALAYLPVGTTTNATKLKYLLFKVNDATVVMAQEWINSSTLKQVSTGTVTVVITNTNLSESQRIRSALAAAGFQVSSITA